MREEANLPDYALAIRFLPIVLINYDLISFNAVSVFYELQSSQSHDL